MSGLCRRSIGAGERTSLQPMANRDGEIGDDQLHHLISSRTWEAAELEAVLPGEADRAVGGADAWLNIDGAALSK